MPGVMIAPPSYKCRRKSSLSARILSVSVDMVCLRSDDVELSGASEAWVIG